MPPASSCKRSARRRNWSGDSSPETYSVAMPWLSSRAAHCMRSVDLPMPGSPPTRTTEPGTMPPPSTKSNSANPVRQRSLPTVGRLESWTGTAVVSFQPSNFPTFRPTTSSTSEFHAPHASHFPPHLGWSAPHSVHRKTEWALDTADLEGGSLARRVVVEARVFLLEVQLHGAGRAIALFPDDHLRNALDAFVCFGVHRAVVELLPIDEADNVGVLLDCPGLAQVGQLRPLGIDQPFRAEQPLHELILRHLQRKEGDAGVVLDRGVLHDVQRERRLAHGWTRGDDDEIGALEASRVAIQIDESARDPSQRACARLELLDPLHRRPDQLLDPDELLGAPELGHLKDAVLRIVEHFSGGTVALVDVLDDAGGRLDEPAQHRLVAHDPGVVVDVVGGGDDIDERRDVFHPTRAVQAAPARQLIAQRHWIDDVAALGQRQHRAEQQPMPFPVEHRVVQDFSGFERCVLVEHHGAEDGLLSFITPWGLPTRELSRRGGERRYGRHPRLVSSNEGYAAGQPGRDLIVLREPILGRPALHDVADEDLLPRQLDRLENLGEQLARPTYEGAAGFVFGATRAFSNDDEARRGGPFPRNRVDPSLA